MSDPRCEGCGGACCLGLPGMWVTLTAADLAREPRLSAALTPDPDGGAGRLADGGACAFLAAGRCSIYETRPGVCRDFAVGCGQCDKSRRLVGLPVLGR